MLAAASAQARTPRLYLQCRRKSTLSAINRTLDQSIRRDRRKALDDLNKTNDERGATFPWQNHNNRPRSNGYARNPSADYEDREDRHTSISRDRNRNQPDRNAGFTIRKSNKRPEGNAIDENPRYDILNIPFTDKHHFTQENWNRLMDAVQLAEDKYVRALPTRPSALPQFEKDEPSVMLKVKRQLKKIFKQDLATVEPTLSREKSEWLRVIQHMGDALKNAKSNNIFIPGRRWFEESDPTSAIKASHYPIQPSPTPTQGTNRTQELQEMSVLNKDMRSTILQALVDKNAAAVISGQELRPVDLTAALDVSRSARKAKERDEEMQKDSFKEAKERRKLEEESRLDDDQLFSLINNNREKNNDRKNKYKEIQEPRDRRDRDSRSSPQASRDDRDAYVSIPYTTAASEFLYGFNVVIAALTARRRQMYNVYIHSRALSNSSSASNIKNLCRKAGVRFTDVDDSFLPKMDKMAQGRPHNGLILEASPLPTLPTKSLGKIGVTDMAIPIELADQSAEEAKVNGTPSTIPFHYAHTWRKPLVLLLDGILDPGNLGNILRTAHFYGIDAVAICTNTCAPVNLPIVQKAASGAAEALTILSIPTPANFITTCKKHGWTVHAAVAPNATSAKSSKGNLVTSNMISPLSRSPSILMIGAEGEGLRANLATKADANVGIRGAKPALPELDVGVDSLNVGSSVAVLLEAFFRKPDNLEDVPEDMPRDDTVSGRIV
ncbi:alpha/beta knot, partial [Aureobasidium melanogenum]